jgi:hypothetical protein
MARFYGEIGYKDGTVETKPGVYVENIVEYSYYGDVLLNSRNLEDGVSVNDDISVGNSIRIVADAYAREHMFAMRYIKWQGVLWKVLTVTEERPRLLLRLGGKYNGPKASAPVSP